MVAKKTNTKKTVAKKEVVKPAVKAECACGTNCNCGCGCGCGCKKKAILVQLATIIIAVVISCVVCCALCCNKEGHNRRKDMKFGAGCPEKMKENGPCPCEKKGWDRKHEKQAPKNDVK